MKANEFRIGNYVRWKDNDKVWRALRGTYDKITANDIPFFDEDEERANLIVEAIELTEDILLKCGFELIYDGYYAKELYLIQDTRFEFLINKQNFELSGLIYKGDTYLYMRYLHELQNLYYAITKKELEVNL